MGGALDIDDLDAALDGLSKKGSAAPAAEKSPTSEGGGQPAPTPAFDNGAAPAPVAASGGRLGARHHRLWRRRQ